jgi:rubrerythrin
MTEASDDAALVAELDDLLQLDYDALATYQVALAELRDPQLREQLALHRDDHRRHVDQLTQLLRTRGAMPATLPHLTTAPLKLLAQAAAVPCGDTAVLLAFKANERLTRDKYARAARRSWPADVGAVLGAAASDEARHYDWAVAALEQRDTMGVRHPAAMFETMHAGLADLLEAVQKEARQMRRAR